MFSCSASFICIKRACLRVIPFPKTKIHVELPVCHRVYKHIIYFLQLLQSLLENLGDQCMNVLKIIIIINQKRHKALSILPTFWVGNSENFSYHKGFSKAFFDPGEKPCFQLRICNPIGESKTYVVSQEVNKMDLWKFCANGKAICITFGWNGQVEYFRSSSVCFGKR